MNTILFAILSGVFLSFSQVILKYIINAELDLKAINIFDLKIFILILTLFTFVGFGLLFWFIAVRRSTLISIYWTTSIYYILVPLFSMLLLGEKLTKGKLVGYIIIMLGAFISSIS